jgi:hypothetical protein
VFATDVVQDPEDLTEKYQSHHACRHPGSLRYLGLSLRSQLTRKAPIVAGGAIHGQRRRTDDLAVVATALL